MLKKLSKILTVFLTVVILMTTVTSPISAAVVTPEVTPQWVSSNDPSFTVRVANSKLYVTVSISSVLSNVTYTNGVVTIVRREGTSVTGLKTCTELSGNGSFYFSDNSVSVTKGETYRITVVVTAHYNNTTETVTGYYDYLYQ